MIHFRDDKLIGEKLNKYFGREDVDFRLSECYKTGCVLWSLNSYLEYQDIHMLSKFCSQITVLNEGGQITAGMIRCICNEIFPRYSRLTALISPENKQALKFVRIVGFTYEGSLRRVDRGKDISIFSLFEEEYREKWEIFSKV